MCSAGIGALDRHPELCPACLLAQVRLPPNVSRILFVRNLPFKVTAEELYEVFGRYGAIRQLRIGEAGNKKTRGTAFVVMEDIFDAKSAVDNLSGFSVGGRYLTVLFYKAQQRHKAVDVEAEKREIAELKRKHGLDSGDEAEQDDGGVASLAQRRGRVELGAAGGASSRS